MLREDVHELAKFMEEKDPEIFKNKQILVKVNKIHSLRHVLKCFKSVYNLDINEDNLISQKPAVIEMYNKLKITKIMIKLNKSISDYKIKKS
jgi:bisphosphoglycerate-dependent phosphoglycerate mutase